MTSISDPLVGRLLDGRYQITARLARGGMATVYQAVDTRLTRTVAVKVMHIGLGDDAEFAKKFDREARAAARLSHPHVVSVFDQGSDPADGAANRPYIVMEYVDGRTLRDVINREAPLPPLRALEIIEPVLAALACAHDAGLVHRDVKPENVLISDRGQLKVADFGLAKAITSQTSTATQGLLIGTVSYLPPELVVSGKADARSDVYSAGVVLFELLTGQKPHTGDTPIQVAYAHVHKDVPAPSGYPTAGPVPPYLDALVARATARDAALRPPDARVMLTQVRRVRAALRDGLADDPELTQDLSIVRRELVDAPQSDDRADYEVTQLVPAPEVQRPVAPAGPATPVTDPTIPAAGASTAPFRSAAPARPADARTDPWRPVRPSSPRSPGPRTPFSPPTVLDAPPPAVARPAYQPSPERVAAARERRTRKRRRGWLAFLLVLLLATVALLTSWYLLDGRFTSAPALATLTQAQAQEVAGRAGLTVHFEDTYSETVGKGQVVSSEPGPGEKVRDGTEIAALVSQGPERHPMPTVVGRTQGEAAQALTAASLAVGTVTTTYSDSVAAGVVVRASQDAGVSLRRDTAVNLVVSSGPKPIPVASWVGKSAADATKALKKAGFSVKETATNSDTVAKGDVISQTPDSGTGVKGDTVSLTTSKGPVMVTVPNVRKMGVRAAEKVMRDAGFRTRTRAVRVNYLGLGYVSYSGPSARSRAPKGSTITLYVV